MTLPYSGRDASYNHKDDEIWHTQKSDGHAPVKKVTLIDAQWSTMPHEVYEDVERLWRFMELGNDKYFYKFTTTDLFESLKDGWEVEEWYWGATPEEQKGWVTETTHLPYLVQWLKEQNFDPNEKLYLHYWW